MGAAFPGDEVVDYLRMFYEVWHAQPEYYCEVWLQCGHPINIWEALMRMPEPTSAKWQASHPTTRHPAPLYLSRCSHLALTSSHTSHPISSSGSKGVCPSLPAWAGGGTWQGGVSGYHARGLRSAGATSDAWHRRREPAAGCKHTPPTE